MVDLLVGELALRTFVREELRAGAPVHAPDLLTLEVLSALTRIVREGGLTRSESRAVLDAYAALPVARHASHPFWRRIADLSDPHSAYDAAYVVLAEALDAPLLTTDGRLARAVTTVEVIDPR